MSSVASMKKWGIPPSSKQNAAPEITLLERLVWVRYQGHWWPALLYHSYSELQQHLYDQLDMVLKAQFAMAIMRHMQDKSQLKIARLLGRPILEVIEVEEDCYCEFYWQLPNVLPKACKRSKYGDNLELYFDFHRALDQVEDIIRDVSEENFALMPHNDHLSWLERAEIALNEDNRDEESLQGRPSVIDVEQYASEQNNPYDSNPAAPSQTHVKHLSTPSPPSMALSTHPKEIPANTAAHEEPSSIWDSMMKSISQSFGDDDKKVTKKRDPNGTRDPVNRADPVGSAIDSRSRGPVRDADVTTPNRAAVPIHVEEDVDFTGRSGLLVGKGESLAKKEQSKQKKKASSRKPRTGTTTKQKKTKKSDVSKESNSSSEVSAAKLNNLTKTQRQAIDNKIRKNEILKPSPERRIYGSKKTQLKKETVPTKNTPDETRDPPSESAKASEKDTQGETALVPANAVQVLPGLEGDDIMPGLSDKVSNARNIWSSVWSQMMVTKDSPDSIPVNFDSKADMNDAVCSTNAQKEVVTALAAEGTPVEETELALEKAAANLSLWQRMTNCA